MYGLGALADDELAVRGIFALKGRPATHPLIIHVENLTAARTYAADIPAHGVLLARAFWPGPLTLICDKSPRALDAVTGGQPSVALRVPAHPLALELLREVRSALAAPSANRFGKVSPTSAQHVLEDFGAEAPLTLDGGPCTVGVESTIVDVRGATVRILRPGGVSAERLASVLGYEPPEAQDRGVPGSHAVHYAPRSGVKVVSVSELPQVYRPGAALIVPTGTPVPAGAPVVFLDAAPEAFAKELYAALRRADSLGELTLVVPPAAHGLGRAVADRLQRASARST